MTWMRRRWIHRADLLRQLRPPRATSGSGTARGHRLRRSPTAHGAVTPAECRTPRSAVVPGTGHGRVQRGLASTPTTPTRCTWPPPAPPRSASGHRNITVTEPRSHPKIAGLWRIEPGDADDSGYRTSPDPQGSSPAPPPGTRPRSSATSPRNWASTPEILEAYTWATDTRRYFDQWYQVVRDARAAMMAAAAAGDTDADVVLQAVKEHLQAHRRPARPGRRRQDPRARCTGRTGGWRSSPPPTSTCSASCGGPAATDRHAGRWRSPPTKCSTCPTNKTPRPRLPQPLRLGNGLGQFKVTRSTPMTDEIRQGVWPGKH